jgi:hypothetical protein
MNFIGQPGGRRRSRSIYQTPRLHPAGQIPGHIVLIGSVFPFRCLWNDGRYRRMHNGLDGGVRLAGSEQIITTW